MVPKHSDHGWFTHRLLNQGKFKRLLQVRDRSPAPSRVLCLQFWSRPRLLPSAAGSLFSRAVKSSMPQRGEFMTASHSTKMAESADRRPITVFGPDFPFPYDDWINHPKGLGKLPPERLGTEVAVIGAGMAGMVAAYELMRMGLKPV